MTKTGYLILGIAILVALLVVFVVSFIIYVRTPAPKGCEHLKISEENCSSCSHEECRFYKGEEKK